MTRRRRKKELIVGGKVTYRNVAADQAEFEEAMVHAFGMDPRNIWRYEPPPSAVIPKAGAWCMIREQLPPMEREIDQHLTVGRVFWCEHQSENCDDEGFAPDGSYMVLARTPFGEPKLLPHEYVSVSIPMLMEVTQVKGFTFHPAARSTHQMTDTLFYCMSRGIPRAEAMVMALGTLSGPVGWFEPHPDLIPTLESLMRIGTPLSAVNHERRAAAQAARRQHETDSR